MKLSKKGNETIIYLFIWLIVCSLPIFTQHNNINFSWSKVVLDWIRFLPFLLIFILNNALLVPKLLFKKRYFQYLGFLTLAIIVIVFLFDYTKYLQDYLSPHRPPRLDDMEPFGMDPFNGIPPKVHPGGIIRIFDLYIISFLVVGFNTAVKFVFKRQEEEQKNEEQKKIHIQTELSFLRQQISPHFFMNTLNNIHALVDINTEGAKDAIIRLSQLMNYMLYETQTEKVQLQKEMDFTSSFVELMKLRFTDDVTINLIIPDTIPPISIPPLLTISFIENAFKHGISYEGNSFVTISFKFTNDRLFFEIENSDYSKKETSNNSGIGLQNSHNRLHLLYGDNYDLSINTLTNNRFSVKLNIPI